MGNLDNDMDELFSKAGNHYPLKTDGADWDKLMSKLPDAKITPLPIADPKTAQNNSKLLWLILLIPMGLFCYSYFNEHKNNFTNDVKIPVVTASKKEDNTIKIIGNQDSTSSGLFIKKDKIIKQQKFLIQKFSNNDIKNNVGDPIFSKQNTNASTYVFNGSEEEFATKIIGRNKNNETVNPQKAIQKNKVDFDKDNNLINAAPIASANIDKQSSIPNEHLVKADTTQKLTVSKTDSIQPKTTDAIKNIVKKSIQKSKGFYVSVLGGFDASSVKSQGIKKTGYGFGLLVGYNFNKHLAVETGLLWDKKQYFTNGEYFNKTRTNIPYTVTLLDMNGTCNMFELPIDFRYNFLQNNKSLFFGTAGLSSYFMKKEDYDYGAISNGLYWSGMKTYNNSGSNFLSILNISVGYEHKISKLGSVRINPYFKIPLKGLGIGSLPITSSGVNVGLTIPFHK